MVGFTNSNLLDADSKTRRFRLPPDGMRSGNTLRQFVFDGLQGIALSDSSDEV